MHHQCPPQRDELDGGRILARFDAHRRVHQHQVRSRIDEYRLAVNAEKRLASEEGYDPAEVDSVLLSDMYADAVAVDKACARQRGADDVPFL